MIFKSDPKDRKRRFLRGLNFMLGVSYICLEDDIPLSECLERFSLSEFRNRIAHFYCLEFTNEELTDIIKSGMTTGKFTEKYCHVAYKDRGNVDLNVLMNNAMRRGAVDLREIDNAPKYGLNGSAWCDVAEGPCSCGAWHH